MRHKVHRTVGFLLLLLLVFPFQAYAGRKHGDVEDIGNRGEGNSNGRGVLTIF